MVRTLVEKFRPILQRYQPYMGELEKADVSYKVDFWTPLKLYVVASYIHTCYVKIISKNPAVDGNFYYIDLLSNAGLNLVSSCKDCTEIEKCSTCSKGKKKKPPHPFPGSPLLAATANPPFKKMYFIDTSKEKLTALDNRLRFLTEKGLCGSMYTLVGEDCNKAIAGVITEIRNSGAYNFLAFADNSGLDVNWSTIQSVLDCQYCDLIINYPTSNIKRAFGQSRTQYDLKKLHDFFGCEIEKEVRNEDELLEYYISRLRKSKGVDQIHIDTEIAYSYDLLILTKPDAGYNRYIENIKKSIEKVSAKDVEDAFEVLAGRQSTLFY